MAGVRELLGMIFNTLYANEATVYRKHAANVSGRERFVCLSGRRSLILGLTFANFKRYAGPRVRELHFRNVFIVTAERPRSGHDTAFTKFQRPLTLN